jgi:hypothetical protein
MKSSIFKRIYKYFESIAKPIILKKIDFFFEFFAELYKNRVDYFLNLIGYYETNFIRFLKIVFLYFILKLIFDSVYLFFFFLFQIYLVLIEIIFDTLLEIKYIFYYFGKYLKIFVKIGNGYHIIINWFFYFFSFSRLRRLSFRKLKKFIRTFSFFKIIDFFLNFSSNLVWFFFVRKETRRKYLVIRKFIVIVLEFCFRVFATIAGFITAIFYMPFAFIYAYYMSRIYGYLVLPKAKTKKRLVLILLYRLFKRLLKYILLKLLDLFVYIILCIRRLIRFIKKYIFRK